MNRADALAFRRVQQDRAAAFHRALNDRSYCCGVLSRRAAARGNTLRWSEVVL